MFETFFYNTPADRPTNIKPFQAHNSTMNADDKEVFKAFAGQTRKYEESLERFTEVALNNFPEVSIWDKKENYETIKQLVIDGSMSVEEVAIINNPDIQPFASPMSCLTPKLKELKKLRTSLLAKVSRIMGKWRRLIYGDDASDKASASALLKLPKKVKTANAVAFAKAVDTQDHAEAEFFASQTNDEDYLGLDGDGDDDGDDDGKDGEDGDDDGKDGDEDGKDGKDGKKKVGKGVYGNGNNRKKAGAVKDLFPTPESCTLAMIFCVGLVSLLGKGAKILEPCHGNGAISSILEEKGFDVTKLDKYTLPVETDALTDPAMKQYMEDCDCIITNVPFSSVRDFVRLFYLSGKMFIVLVPFHFLTNAGAEDLLLANGATILCPTPTPKFKREDGSDAMVGSVVWLIGNAKRPEAYAKFSGRMQFVLMPTKSFEKNFVRAEGETVRRTLCRFQPIGASAGASAEDEVGVEEAIMIKRKKPTLSTSSSSASAGAAAGCGNGEDEVEDEIPSPRKGAISVSTGLLSSSESSSPRIIKRKRVSIKASATAGAGCGNGDGDDEN